MSETEALTCCDGTGWNGDTGATCYDHYQPNAFITEAAYPVWTEADTEE